MIAFSVHKIDRDEKLTFRVTTAASMAIVCSVLNRLARHPSRM
ncbi:hypothetical protein E5Q_00617 [Mixia osmundae IAM 14324]|uniref:Uncharacterized protein n=1 Tax=Mixia osmundae (strain CBS 9802 / IAM 14324 / JCM 22182 / KY 12970) TaxID=764103 RepID=G7DTR1_MIXOS|nr:hypothetical protein E5Q_00617 [Mixia osmundae IAM 14324]